MRPDPSGLDLEETEEDAEFGELDIDEAVVQRTRSVAPAPDLGSIPMMALDAALDHSTAAEYATATNQGPSPTEHDELERELGVDLSVRERGGISALSHASPIPGRASVRAPLSSAAARQTSSAYEPYAMAPSADVPPTRDRSPYPPSIEPPSHPPSAPPPESMTEPEERPSSLPDVDEPPLSVDAPALSSAPSEDELDRMFDAISMPPPVHSIKMTPALPASMDAPLPSDFLIEKGDRSSSPPSGSVAPPSGTVRVDGIEFLAVEGFQDLTDEAAYELARSAEIVSVAPGQRLGNFGVAIVTSGALALSPEGRSAGFAAVRKGEVLYTRGTMGSGLSIVAMSIEPDTRVAVFSREDLDSATIECPWVSDELSEIADDYQARCGAVLGHLGTALDDMFRPMVLEKCVVKRKSPGDIIAQAGSPMDGLYVLGVGSLQLLSGDGTVAGQLNSGDIVFPETLLGGSPASATVRVGKDGALVLYAARMSAHELLATCPPFIEILAGA
jgi:CRP-like cAMP-binding protein